MDSVQFFMPIFPSNLQNTPKDKKANMVIHGLVDKVLHFTSLVEKLPGLDIFLSKSTSWVESFLLSWYRQRYKFI